MSFSECSICMDNENPCDRNTAVMCPNNVCAMFHKRCLKEWIDRHHKCPICRNTIESIEKALPVDRILHHMYSSQSPSVTGSSSSSQSADKKALKMAAQIILSDLSERPHYITQSPALLVKIGDLGVLFDKMNSILSNLMIFKVLLPSEDFAAVQKYTNDINMNIKPLVNVEGEIVDGGIVPHADYIILLEKYGLNFPRATPLFINSKMPKV